MRGYELLHNWLLIPENPISDPRRPLTKVIFFLELGLASRHEFKLVFGMHDLNSVTSLNCTFYRILEHYVMVTT